MNKKMIKIFVKNKKTKQINLPGTRPTFVLHTRVFLNSKKGAAGGVIIQHGGVRIFMFTLLSYSLGYCMTKSHDVCLEKNKGTAMSIDD